jgi:outer membrane murein-binding lipoprotein Lpp
MSSQTLIITGMHRSGTSLTASLLQSAGLDVGQRLLMENESNPKGHYEDLDFVNFHEDVLDAQGLNTAGWTLDRSIPISELLKPRVASLLAQNADKPLWGWKDPRTVLFLDFWRQTIPDAKFLFVHRQPWEVMDSLFRRGNPTFIKNPNFALEVWQHYNQLILEFYQEFPARSLLLSLDTITQNPQFLTQVVADKLNISLQTPEIDRYDKTLLQHTTSHHALLLQTHFPASIDLYTQLLQHSLTPSDATPILHHQNSPTSSEILNSPDSQNSPTSPETPSSLSSTPLTSPYLPLPPSISSPNDYKPWIAKDWVDYCALAKEKKNLETHVQQLHAEIIRLHGEITRSHTELTQAHEEIQRSHTEIHKSHTEIQHMQALAMQVPPLEAQLRYTHTELEQVRLVAQQAQGHLAPLQTELQQAKEEIAELQGIIRGMESSKFWGLRRAWMKLKKLLGVA